MNDTIYRQAAIDALANNMPSLTTPDGCGQFDHDIQVVNETYVDCMQIIHELPSAQPERKVGYWIVFETDNDKYVDIKCSCCRKNFTVDSCRRDDIGFIKEDLCYCPNCGTKMEVKHDNAIRTAEMDSV